MTAAPTRTAARASEGFVRVPFRVTDALRDGEITFVQYAVLVFVADRVWRCHGSPYVTRLETVAADLQWTHGAEYLRQTLVELDADGWIRAVRKAGSKTWSITLRAAAIDPSENTGTGPDAAGVDPPDPPTDLTGGPPSEGKPPTDLQLTSNYPQGSELEVASNSPAPSTALVPLAQADRGPFKPPTADPLKKRTKREEQTLTPPESPPRRVRNPDTPSPYPDIVDDCPVCDTRTTHRHRGEGRYVCVDCGVIDDEALTA